MASVPQYQQVQQQQQQQPLTDIDRLRVALSLKNIAQRCEHTLTVLSSASTKDEFPLMGELNILNEPVRSCHPFSSVLHLFRYNLNISSLQYVNDQFCFPSYHTVTVSATIDAIFATYTGGVNSWELRTLSRTAASTSALTSQDFACLSTFLDASGPFLEMIYRLTTDSNIAFSFPVGFLPAPARKKIQAGDIPQFYRNKINLPPASSQGRNGRQQHPLLLKNIAHRS